MIMRRAARWSLLLPCYPQEALKPTLFAGVPRVFERIYSGINDQARGLQEMRTAPEGNSRVCCLQVAKSGLLKKLIFDYAYYRKRWFMRAGWRHDSVSGAASACAQLPRA